MTEELFNSRPEERFCDIFARHFLLPDRIVIPRVSDITQIAFHDKYAAAKELYNLVTEFQVTPDIFRDWLCGCEEIDWTRKCLPLDGFKKIFWENKDN